MPRLFIPVACALAILGSGTISSWGSAIDESTGTSGATGPASAELKAMYAADQSDRVGPDSLLGKTKNWAELKKRDDVRYARLQALLKEGKLVTREDYYYGAMILQHGTIPSDYLLAHILAGAAAQLGSRSARSLSAAALDRYLQSVGQPQVFGTQYSNQKDKTVWTQEPFNPDLVSDQLRRCYDEPNLEESRQRLKEMAALYGEERKDDH